MKAHLKGVCDLLLREQLLESSSKDLQVFVKEHSCKTAEELARLSDRYLEAHGEGNEQIWIGVWVQWSKIKSQSVTSQAQTKIVIVIVESKVEIR